jgi:hypothetical protein
MEKEGSLGRAFSAGRKLLSSIAQSSIYLSIAGDFGYPAALLQLIKTRPGLRAVIEEPSQCRFERRFTSGRSLRMVHQTRS